MIDPDIRHESAAERVPDRTVRQFAAIGAVFLLGFAAREFFMRGAVGRAELLAAAAVVVLLTGLLRPGIVRPVLCSRRRSASSCPARCSA
jgi:hypothetical protein